MGYIDGSAWHVYCLPRHHTHLPNHPTNFEPSLLEMTDMVSTICLALIEGMTSEKVDATGIPNLSRAFIRHVSRGAVGGRCPQPRVIARFDSSEAATAWRRDDDNVIGGKSGSSWYGLADIARHVILRCLIRPTHFEPSFIASSYAFQSLSRILNPHFLVKWHPVMWRAMSARP